MSEPVEVAAVPERRGLPKGTLAAVGAVAYGATVFSGGFATFVALLAALVLCIGLGRLVPTPPDVTGPASSGPILRLGPWRTAGVVVWSAPMVALVLADGWAAAHRPWSTVAAGAAALGMYLSVTWRTPLAWSKELGLAAVAGWLALVATAPYPQQQLAVNGVFWIGYGCVSLFSAARGQRMAPFGRGLFPLFLGLMLFAEAMEKMAR